MTITVILKGDINRQRQFKREFTQLESAFPNKVTLLHSEHPGHAIALAAEHGGNCKYLIAAGGDGTINEVVNACLTARATGSAITTPPPIFGQLAYGTANDLVRSLGLNGRVEELIALIERDSVRQIDVGALSCLDPAGSPVSRYYLNVAETGLGARVIEKLSGGSRILGGNVHYLRTVLPTFMRYRAKDIRVESDRGLLWEGPSMAVMAANGRYFASGLCIAPGAALDDGQLAVTLIGDVTARDFVANLPRLKRGQPLEHAGVKYQHATTLTIDCPGSPLPVEADGEYMGTTPATMEVVPAAIKFLMARQGESQPGNRQNIDT